MDIEQLKKKERPPMRLYKSDFFRCDTTGAIP